jgi:hypothetical protein
MGESGQFRVMRVRNDGSQEEALAQWSVAGPHMTVQAANGIAVGATPGIGQLRASVNGISTVRAVRVVPDMRGTWTGTFVLSCAAGDVTRVIGEGPGPCKTPTITNRAIFGAPEQAGEAVAGVFTIFDYVTGAFTGRVGVDGSWDWPGFTAAAISSHGTPTDYIFKGWRMTFHAVSGQVSGSGSVEHKHTNNWGYQHYSFRNVTMTLQRLTTQ